MRPEGAGVTDTSWDTVERAPLPPPEAIVVRDVWRGFGSSEALRGINFTAASGEVTGLVGPNGAGKTTLLLILATLLAPERGQVLIGGRDPMTEAQAVRRMLGWVPDSFGFYENLTAREYVTFAGSSRKLRLPEAQERATELLGEVRLEEHADRPVHLLSRGQKQRLAFASALVHRPRVLLLDEPAAGLDPSGRSEFLRLARRLAGDGTAVVVSSHLLADLEQLADRVVFVDRGVVVGERRIGGPPGDPVRRPWLLHALDDRALAAALTARGLDPVRPVPSGVEISLDSEESAATLLADLIAAGIAVVTCTPSETSLEAAYFELTVPE